MDLDRALAEEMSRWEAAGLRRVLSPASAPRDGGDFTSNDYHGLSVHPAVIDAAREALAEGGAGGRASRLLGGGTRLEGELEELAADWLGSEAALFFPSGYQANLGLLTALAGPGDALLSDELNHSSLIDGARLSRARVRTFRHKDVEELDRLLEGAAAARRRLVVTESVFSMDGDLAPLEKMHELCEARDAWLVVDEAHAAGLLGPEGSGAWGALGRPRDSAPRLAARVITGGKALGVCGAVVCGSRALREHLLNRARQLMYTTASSPAVVAAFSASIELLRGGEIEIELPLERARALAEALDLPRPAAGIVPLVLGAEEAAMAAERELASQGFSVRAVRPPTIPPGTSRLRIVCHAYNRTADVARLAAILVDVRGRLPRALGAAPEPARVRRAPALVVAGTDSGIGKTVISALLLRTARRLGPGRYWKPVQTGDDSDTAEVARLAELPPGELPPPAFHFALPASPHEAAAAEGAAVSIDSLEGELERLRREQPDAPLLVELAGGLQVPLTPDFTQIDWLARLRLPLVLVARSGLGTLNHTLLSLEALRARHLDPLALFLVGPPHPSNRETLRRLGGVEAVLQLPELEPPGAAAFDRWLDAQDLGAVLDALAPEP